MEASRESSVITLSNGRRLGYAEYGDPSGRPLMVLHGTPSSRLLWGLLPNTPFTKNLRVIAPDRPGYGLSDYNRNALMDWPGDAAELADHLGIDKFALLGASGGGPYALACAWKMPERLTSVGVYGSVGPALSDTTKGVVAPVRLLWALAGPLQPLLRLDALAIAAAARCAPELVIKASLAMGLGKRDREMVGRPEIMAILKKDFKESFRQGGSGFSFDATVPGAWPIPLEEIKTKVRVWHMEEDRLVGGMARHIAEKVPNSVLTIISGASHLWIIDHMAEILEGLMEG